MMNGIDLALAAALVVWVIHGENWLRRIVAAADRMMPDSERRRW